MNILHLTDLHFNSESYEKFTQHNMIEKLLENLNSLEKKIDLIIFSGDLVFKGNDIADFENAKKEFLDKLCEKLKINYNDIILCPGNHDMDRTYKSESLEEKFQTKINNSDALFDFFKNKDYDYKTALKTTENYNIFIKDYYKNDNQTIINDLYTIHKKNIQGNEIAILSLNSSWRSVDDTSNGKLLFPKFLLEDALYELKQIKCKFLVLHHPIHWFKDFNQSELQNLIFKSCNIMFSGHIHESEITTHYKQNNGIFAHVSPASLTWEKEYIGYSIIEFDPKNESNARVSKYHFSTEKDNFNFIEVVEVKIPCGEEKDEQNRIREKINSKILFELLNAKDLLLSNDMDDDNDYEFMDKFNNPRIKTKPKQELVETSESPESTIIELNSILKNDENYFIYGHDKSGKTSLLKYIQIYHLKNYTKNGNVPFYIDFKNIDSNTTLIDLMKKYFELSKEKTKKLISDHNFRLLIDNFEPNHPFKDEIDKFLLEFPNAKFVITCDYLTSRLFEEYHIDNREYIKLYLHDITRNDLRTYLEKDHFYLEKNHDEIQTKIISFCKQLDLPLNYWTISLLLMIHKKSQFDLSKNIYNLLDLCVDEILQKKLNILTKSKVEFKQLKSICAHLAKFLLIDNQENIYSKSYSDVLNELDNYLKLNNRIKAQASELMDYLIKSGVFKVKEDDKITFRLNGIFEFFIAQAMSEDNTFRDDLLDNKVYLSFKNEFEIYSGIKNHDVDFLKTIYKKTKMYFTFSNGNYEQIGKPDLLLISKVADKNDVSLEEIAKKLNPINPINNDLKDSLIDEFDPVNNLRSDVYIKKVYNTDKLDSEVYEIYISILSRVFKTMDGVIDKKLLSDIIDLLLETYINFGFFMHKEYEEEVKKISNADNENILKIIKKFLPFISQVTMSENVAQHNIENLLIDKINELKSDSKNNQYKLFILYFILMDIDEQNIYDYCDELIDIIELGVLKYSVILKLNYYFNFKSTKNKTLSNFLKEKIKIAKIKMDNKIDKDKLQSHLDNRGKTNFFKK